MAWGNYVVWMRYLPDRGWVGDFRKTNHVIRAQSLAHANRKMRQYFANAGFVNMSLRVEPESKIEREIYGADPD